MPAGKTILKNEPFKKEFVNTDIKNELSHIQKELKSQNQVGKNTRVLEINNKIYEVTIQIIKKHQKKKEETILVSFQNITEKMELEKKCKDLETCIGVIVIDNYEETIRKD